MPVNDAAAGAAPGGHETPDRLQAHPRGVAREDIRQRAQNHLR